VIHFGLVYSIEGGSGDRSDVVFREAVEEIVLAEQLGLESAFISEHHFLENGFFPSPLIALSFIAARTSKIKFGPGVMLLPLYDPVHVAEDCAVLDIISGGRLILGVGQGYRQEEFDAFGVDLNDRSARMREGVTLIRKLWTEPAVTFSGKQFQAKDLPLNPKPFQKPAPPIWVAAKKRHAVQLAAEVGDGWFADPITPLSIVEKNKVHWENTLRAKGVKPTDRAFAYYRDVHVGEDDAAATRGAREQVMEGYRNYLRWGHLVDDENKPLAPDRDDLLEGFVNDRFTLGGPETCASDITKLCRRLGITDLIMKMKFPGLSHQTVMKSISLFGQKVLPLVNRK
jgi:alkanesulfonate monooxygenase SsuD/methylene tetrahydromethanopterin reductase-like flavin-dependent oxidoreductase (luciferase family)